MVVGAVLFLILIAGAAVLGISIARKEMADKKAGIHHYGGFSLRDGSISYGGRTHRVTRKTSAAVVGAAAEGRRSTVTRTATGAVVGGIPGALVGHAAKKRTSTSNAVLTVDGADWAHSTPVGAKTYRDAVEFAQAVNLAARRAR